MLRHLWLKDFAPVWTVTRRVVSIMLRSLFRL